MVLRNSTFQGRRRCAKFETISRCDFKRGGGIARARRGEAEGTGEGRSSNRHDKRVGDRHLTSSRSRGSNLTSNVSFTETLAHAHLKNTSPRFPRK